MPLLADPTRRVGIPVVSFVGDGACRSFDIGPPMFLTYSTFHSSPDELAAASWPSKGIDLRNKIIVQLYVQTHVLRLAHSAMTSRVAPSAPERQRPRISHTSAS